MGTHPIFESDFDCLTEVIGEAKTAKMSEQIPVEFEEEVDSKSDHSFESVNSSGSNADNESSGQADDSVESIDPFDMICGDDMARGESKRPEELSEEVQEPIEAEPESAEPIEAEPESVDSIDPFDMICGDDMARGDSKRPEEFSEEVQEDAVVEPKSAEPVSAEPVSVEAVSVEAVSAEPVSAEPVSAEPVSAEPVSEPVVAEPEPESIEEIDPFDMICGDDISRLPEVVNPNEKKPEKIEETVDETVDETVEETEEKPSYAAVARSRPTSECNDNELVEDPVVEDIVEEPVKQAAPEPSVSATPKVEAVPEAETEGKQSRAERKTKKAMMKLGLAPVEGINRVVLRKDKTLLFVVPNPEVFRKGDTWVVLGEARVEDPNQRAREMAAAKVAENIQPKTKTEPVQATITEEEEEETDVPADGVEEKDIELVMQQAACTRAKAISALKSNSNDIVNAIMELTL